MDRLLITRREARADRHHVGGTIASVGFFAQLQVTGEVAGDEAVHVEAYWPRPAVAIVPFEVKRALVREQPSHRVDNKVFDVGRFRGEGVHDGAVTLSTFVVAKPSTAFDPFLRQVLARQRPAEEAPNRLILVDHEEKVAAGDLIEEDLRPFAELKSGEGGASCLEIFDRQSQCGGRVSLAAMRG